MKEGKGGAFYEGIKEGIKETIKSREGGRKEGRTEGREGREETGQDRRWHPSGGIERGKEGR